MIEKGADPKIADTDGNTCLHRLACYLKMRTDFKHNTPNINEKRQVEVQTMVMVTRFLITNGAPLNLLNTEKETPFSLALKN